MICIVKHEIMATKLREITRKKCFNEPNGRILYDKRSIRSVWGNWIIWFCYIARNSSNIWRIIGCLALTGMDYRWITRTNWIFGTWTRTWHTCKRYYFSRYRFTKQGWSKFSAIVSVSQLIAEIHRPEPVDHTNLDPEPLGQRSVDPWSIYGVFDWPSKDKTRCWVESSN